MITHDNVHLVFARPELSELQRSHADLIVLAARNFGQAILDNTPQTPRQQSALRYVDIAMLEAIAALGGNG